MFRLIRCLPERDWVGVWLQCNKTGSESSHFVSFEEHDWSAFTYDRVQLSVPV